ncbi:hypothetical protein BDW68DRAFT_173573 [Aspergillus falconensis]
MSDRKVIVVLHTLTLEDPIPRRSLTFSAASDRMEIGRASKRENKNLAPSPHNALFDSRVMSRTHAVLRASLEKKLVYIRDPGSMHGTWLNKEKIPADKDIALSDGDELTFGVEVVRACDTFPPLRVRCECRWLETSKETVQKVQQQTATNTFSVPDDDYDDIEYIGDSLAGRPAAIDLTTDQTSDSNASSAGSGWEDSHSVAEAQSPMTSPAKDIESKDAQSTEISATLKQDIPQKVKPSNEKVVNSEQPLVTPRMTPPSANYDSEDLSGDNQYYDEYFVHSSDEESNVEPEDWDAEAEGEEDEEDEQEEQEEQENNVEEGEQEGEEPVQDEQRQQQDEAVGMSALLNPVPGSFRLKDNQVPNDSTSNFAKSGTNSKQNPSNEDRDAPRMVKTASDHPGLPDPSRVETAASNNLWPENKLPSTVPQQRERSIPGNSSYFPIGPLQPSFANYEAERLRYQSNGQLPGHFSGTNHTLLPPILQKQPPTVRYSFDAMQLQGSYPMNAPYNDGPFATSRPMASAAAPPANTSSSSSKPDIMPFMDSLAPMMPRTACNATYDLTTSSSPKKRKAAEIESDAAEHDHQEPDISSALETYQSSNKDNDLPDVELPDAQPQSDAALINSKSYILNGSESQLTTVSVSENSNEAKESEGPSKMIKTSHRGSIRSHAATAIFGVVVGAVGTITALASLPPDYFA